jgi:hypothetical protein
MGLFLLLLTIGFGSYALFLPRNALKGGPGAPSLTLDGVVSGVVVVGLVGVGAAILLVKLPPRIRAVLHPGSMTHTAQWAWNTDGFWSDTSTYPEGLTRWHVVDTVKVTSRAEVVSILLFGASVLRSISFVGSKEDAEDV